MSISTKKLRSKIQSLSTSLDDLQTQLEPLLAQTLPETIVSLDTIQQANLQVLLPYILNGLVVAHLKVGGTDPKTHPVIGELERVKAYFGKIKEAQNPETRRIEIDQEAATRFINNAIASAQRQQNGDSMDLDAVPTANTSALPSTSKVIAPSVFVLPRITSKMKEREEYEKQIRQEDGEDNEGADEGLQVFGTKESEAADVDDHDMAEPERGDTPHRKRKKSDKNNERKKAKRRKSKGGKETSV